MNILEFLSETIRFLRQSPLLFPVGLLGGAVLYLIGSRMVIVGKSLTIYARIAGGMLCLSGMSILLLLYFFPY